MPDHMPPPPDLVETDRLRLQRLHAGLAPALYATVARTWESLHPWLPWAAQPPTPEGQMEYARSAERSWLDGSDFPYAMLLDEDLVGMTGLHRRQGPETLEIGYWLERARNGQGLMSEAAHALTDVALGGGGHPGLAGIEQVVIHCDEANTASAGVPRRLGYVLAGVREAPVLAPQETGRQQIWRMRREDWRLARRQ